MDPETKLRKAVAGYAKARTVRDDAIREASRNGLSLRQVGKIVGLTHTRIAQIVNEKH